MDHKLQLLGVIFKANKIVYGSKLLTNISNVKYLLLASDSAYNITYKINNKAKYYNIIVNNQYTTKELSMAIGKSNIKVIGITDIGFTNKFISIV